MLCEYATRSLSRCREGEQFDKFDKVQSPEGIYTCWESNPGRPTREAGALPSALHVDDTLLLLLLPLLSPPPEEEEEEESILSCIVHLILGAVAGAYVCASLAGSLHFVPVGETGIGPGRLFCILGRACGRSPGEGISPLLPMLRAHHNPNPNKEQVGRAGIFWA